MEAVDVAGFMQNAKPLGQPKSDLDTQFRGQPPSRAVAEQLILQRARAIVIQRRGVQDRVIEDRQNGFGVAGFFALDHSHTLKAHGS